MVLTRGYLGSKMYGLVGGVGKHKTLQSSSFITISFSRSLNW